MWTTVIPCLDCVVVSTVGDRTRWWAGSHQANSIMAVPWLVSDGGSSTWASSGPWVWFRTGPMTYLGQMKYEGWFARIF